MYLFDVIQDLQGFVEAAGLPQSLNDGRDLLRRDGLDIGEDVRDAFRRNAALIRDARCGIDSRSGELVSAGT